MVNVSGKKIADDQVRQLLDNGVENVTDLAWFDPKAEGTLMVVSMTADVTCWECGDVTRKQLKFRIAEHRDTLMVVSGANEDRCSKCGSYRLLDEDIGILLKDVTE